MRSLVEEIEQRSIEMTREQREIRFRELCPKLSFANREHRLEEASLEDREEYFFLAELLGYKTRMYTPRFAETDVGNRLAKCGMPHRIGLSSTFSKTKKRRGLAVTVSHSLLATRSS